MCHHSDPTVVKQHMCSLSLKYLCIPGCDECMCSGCGSMFLVVSFGEVCGAVIPSSKCIALNTT